MKLQLFAFLTFLAILGRSDACTRVCWLQSGHVYVPCCGRYQPYTLYLCRHFGCRRRSVEQNDEKEDVGFPCKFADYDANKDGEIDQREFTAALDLKKNAALLKGTFEDADKDKSGGISCKEFKTAPYQFKCNPKCLDRGEKSEDEEIPWNFDSNLS